MEKKINFENSSIFVVLQNLIKHHLIDNKFFCLKQTSQILGTINIFCNFVAHMFKIKHQVLFIVNDY